MKMFNNLDSNPSTRIVKCNQPIKVKVINLEKKPWLAGYFNGKPNFEQVTNVTIGRIYDMVAYETMGDVADITIIDDNGKEVSFMECFFDEVEK